MLKKIFIFIIVSSSFILNNVSAGADTNGDLGVYISLDKREFRQDEDIVLRIHIKNESLSSRQFYVYGDNEKISYTTFQPLIRDINGREPEIRVPYILEGKKAGQQAEMLPKRSIVLACGEEFIHRVNLKKVYGLMPDVQYRVKCCFVKDFSKKKIILSENELFFKISSGYYPEKKEMIPDKKAGEYVTPSEIVLLALYAEKKKNWEDFYKYIELESYIQSFPDYHKDYHRADRFGKKKVLKEFSRFLIRKRSDYLLSYRIIDEMIDQNRKSAYVDVIVDRYGARITDSYKYRYQLIQKGQRWYILKLDATVLRGKKR